MQRRQVILSNIQYILNTTPSACKDSPLKHIMKFLQNKYDIYVKGTQLIAGGEYNIDRAYGQEQWHYNGRHPQNEYQARDNYEFQGRPSTMEFP